MSKPTVSIDNPKKVFFPDVGIHKKELAQYYTRIGPWLLPHLQDRPLTLEFAPDGCDGDRFYQKEMPDYYPNWIRRITIPLKQGGRQNQLLANDVDTLRYLVDQGCVTPHTWLSTIEHLQQPDRLIFDLDPSPGVPFAQVKAIARALGERVSTAQLLASGGRGLHVVVPLQATESFTTVREIAKGIAQEVAHRYPAHATTAVNKKKRGKRVFIDYLRNAYGQTTVAPYAVRISSNASVAVPLRWDELSRINAANSYTIKTIFKRLAKVDDPGRQWFKTPPVLAREL